MSGPLRECLAGAISPEVAVARMVLAGATADSIRRDLEAQRSDSPHWAAVSKLVEGRAVALDALAAQVRATVADHNAVGATPAEGMARIAGFFDRAVRFSPEASVAVYSLGDPAILARATDEIVDWLAGQGLLRSGVDVLDLGCGIGRVAAALAPRCRSVLGLDVSAGMVAEAQGRHGHLSNARFDVTDGAGLDGLAEASFDLILAVDTFPYIVQNGPETLRRHLAGAARVLRLGGALAILNLNYWADPERNRADAAAWAAEHGLCLGVAGERPFSLWDGAAFVLHR